MVGKYYGDSEFGSVTKCETAAHYLGTYGLLQEVHQNLCPNHCIDGEAVEERCHVLMEQ